MSDSNLIGRSLHDVGLAVWFGGSLMGAVGLNHAASQITDPTERARIATQGWKAWSPVNAGAIGAHLVGGALLVRANRGRIVGQSGVGSATTVKTALTAAALAATAISGFYGRQLDQAESKVHVIAATEPSAETPEPIAKAQNALRRLQWAIPVLTGAVVVLAAQMGEQQRPAQVSSGIINRLLPD